jgi:hypothetical protein
MDASGRSNLRLQPARPSAGGRPAAKPAPVAWNNRSIHDGLIAETTRISGAMVPEFRSHRNHRIEAIIRERIHQNMAISLRQRSIATHRHPPIGYGIVSPSST